MWIRSTLLDVAINHIILKFFSAYNWKRVSGFAVTPILKTQRRMPTFSRKLMTFAKQCASSFPHVGEGCFNKWLYMPNSLAFGQSKESRWGDFETTLFAMLLLLLLFSLDDVKWGRVSFVQNGESNFKVVLIYCTCKTSWAQTPVQKKHEKYMFATRCTCDGTGSHAFGWRTATTVFTQAIEVVRV